MNGDARYPIGKFHFEGPTAAEERERQFAAIAATPQRLREAVDGLSEAQFDTPYREGGWTVRQVLHHVPDSHMNALIRFKLALTEEVPTIKPYDEARWAELEDARSTPIEVSLRLLEAVHDRWLRVLRSMRPADFERRLIHPDSGVMTLERMLALYAWHGPHHVAHITRLRERMGWSAGRAAGR